MMLSILIPSCKDQSALTPMLREITRTVAEEHKIILSCQNASAAVNRNKCLSHVTVGQSAIMLDDDIEGFYPGWAPDLLEPLRRPRVVMSSARLMNHDGSVGQTCSRCYELKPDQVDIEPGRYSILPTGS